MTIPIHASWKDTALTVETGSYTGDGATTARTISLGFQPSFVFLWREDAGRAFVMNNTSSAGKLNGSTTPEADETTEVHLDSDGFVVGDGDVDGNNSNQDFYYLAFKLAGTFLSSWKNVPYRLTTGSYTGDGTTSGREISPTGGKPDWLFIQKASGGVNFWATADTTSSLAVVPGLADIVQEHEGCKLSTNGFTVGDGNANAANVDTTVYKYAAVYITGYNRFAWKNDLHEVEAGSYTGDGAGSRTIGLNFTPDKVFIKVASSAQTWYGGLGNDNTIMMSPGLVDEVQDDSTVYATTDGIVVDGANTNSTLYNYLAIRTG